MQLDSFKDSFAALVAELPVLGFEVGGNAIWRWIAALAAAILLFGLLRLVVSRFGRRLTRLAGHTTTFADDLMVGVITRLLDRVTRLGLTIKRLYLDRGCFSVPVIRWLQACDVPFEMPVMVLLPEHLHCIWTLPPDDDDFPARWRATWS